MLKSVIGHSEDVDSLDAILEVLEQCRQKLDGYIPQAGILFSAIDYNYSLLLAQISHVYPNIELVGCSTDGELSSHLGFTEDAILLILFCSDDIEIKAGIGHELQQSPKNCAIAALNQAQSKLTASPSFCLAFPDGRFGSKDVALAELQKQLGNSVPIYGGAAAEQTEWKDTFQFYQTQSYCNSLPILVFAGDIQFSHGVASGWKPIGKKAQITKTIGNEVYEINHKPALDFYRHYLGSLAMQTQEFPLAIFETNEDKFFVRAVFDINETQKSLIFGGEIPEGAFIQISEATRDELLEGVKESVTQALTNFTGQTPEIGLVFSCAARKAILGTKTKQEFDLVQSYTNNKFPTIGFYAYAEICPVTPPAPTRLHNGTFVTLILGS